MISKLKKSIVFLAASLFAAQGLAADADAYFFPQNGVQEQLVPGDLSAGSEGIDFVPEDSNKANKSFDKLVSKISTSFSGVLEAQLTLRSTGATEEVLFTLVEDNDSFCLVATLANGDKLIWRKH